MRKFILFLAIGLLLTTISPDGHGQGIALPDKMGLINDYAGQLGNDHREHLRHAAGRLTDEVEINTYLLITLLDPFSNPPMLANSIWEKWEIAEENSILILLVREQNVWYFHWEASPDLIPIMGELVNETNIFQRALQLVRDRQIGNAAVKAFDKLMLNFAGPEPVIEEVVPEPVVFETDPSDQSLDEIEFESFSTESIQSTSETANLTLYYAIGGIAASLILFLLIRAAFMMSCPSAAGACKSERRVLAVSQAAAALLEDLRKQLSAQTADISVRLHDIV